jgi:AcrR family transcriptional regulator
MKAASKTVPKPPRAQPGRHGRSHSKPALSRTLARSESNPDHPADRILQTSRRIVLERGLDSLSFETIAAEAKVNKGATRYYFGSKNGLLAAMLDQLVKSDHVPQKAVAANASTAERVDFLIQSLRSIVQDRESFLLFFEMLPPGLRNSELRGRMKRWYDFWVNWFVAALGFDPGKTSPHGRALGRLCLAVLDGMWVQSEIDQHSREVDPLLDHLQAFLQKAVNSHGVV